MKVNDLIEQAFRYTQQENLDWKTELSKLDNAKLLRQIADNKFILVNDVYYGLKVDDKIVSIVDFTKKKINDIEYQSIGLIVTDPEQKRMGYASELIWALHFVFNEPMFLGGPISLKGEKLINSILKLNNAAHSQNPQMLDSKTGQFLKYDANLYFKKPSLGIVLEDCFYTAKIGNSSWLHEGYDYK